MTLLQYALVGFIAFVAVIIGLSISGTVSNNTCASLYDYQEVGSLIGNFSSLSFNVTVVNQSDKSGIGPAYFLNGLTNKGYWYQIGVGYNWSRYGVLHYSGFSVLSYLEFVTPTVSMPVGNGIQSGDKVLLGMNFSGNNVTLKVYDWNTSFNKSIPLPSYNATYFVGGPYINGTHNDTVNHQGHYTGLLTEWWHTQVYTKAVQTIAYSPYKTQYSGIQLLSNNFGPVPGRTSKSFAGNFRELMCSLDIYNLEKPILNQTGASGIIAVNNFTSYNFSPHPNITIRLTGKEFITK